MASKAAPVLGEDTGFVLREILKMPEAEITRLTNAGIFV